MWALLADLAGALATIHAAGLVHGDVAPQNVLLASGERPHVLVDLGLASGTGARGTPAYMAPEALAGHVEPRGDLYGLGATVIRIVTGRPLFEGATLGELAQRILGGAPPRSLPGVPAPLADLIQRLVARDVDARPASALAVLDELDQLAPAIAPGSARRARPKVGPPPAPATWHGAAPVIEAIGRALQGDGVAVISVVGIAAAGGRQLVDAAVRTWQLAQVARQRSGGVSAGTLDELAVTLGVRTSANAASWVERVARAARRAPELIVIELADDPRAADLVAALVRAPGERAVVVLSDRAPAPRAGVAIQTAPLLDDDGIAALATTMLGAAPSKAWAHGLRTTSGGLALTAIELVRSIASEKDPLGVEWSARTTSGTAELRGRQLRALAAGPRRIAAAIAAWGGRARIDRVLATSRAESSKTPLGLAEIAELERAGLVRRQGEELAIERATLEALETLIGAGALASLAAIALTALELSPAEVAPTWIAPLLERAPLDAARGELACSVAEQLLARGRAEHALGLARRAIPSLPARAGLLAARAAAATGAHREATSLARQAATAGADPVAAQLVIARASS